MLNACFDDVFIHVLFYFEESLPSFALTWPHSEGLIHLNTAFWAALCRAPADRWHIISVLVIWMR